MDDFAKIQTLTSFESRAEVAQRAIVAENEGLGVMVALGDGKGSFSFSTNMNKVHAAWLLEHIAKHLRGECKC